MKKLTKISMTVCALVLLAFLPASSGQEKQGQGPDAQAQKGNKKVVYVCACLKNRSCACMTEAKTEGPCACGTEGGPPMTAVPKDSDWAKENRKALEK